MLGIFYGFGLGWELLWVHLLLFDLLHVVLNLVVNLSIEFAIFTHLVKFIMFKGSEGVLQLKFTLALFEKY